MNLVPLIGYSKVDHEEIRYAGNWDDCVTKLWALVKYKELVPGPFEGKEVPQIRTLEMCVKARGLFDFCGGQTFFSPQLQWFREGQWGTQGYANTDGVSSVHSAWGAIVASDQDLVIDLHEFTGQEFWTKDELKSYAVKCIANACLTQLMSRTTLAWTCTDSKGGLMKDVHEEMCGRTDAHIPSQLHLVVPVVNKEYKGGHAISCLSTYKINTHDHTAMEYRNVNSGNKCFVMVGEAEFTGGPLRECEDCGDEYDYLVSDECPNCGSYDCDDDGREHGPNDVLSGQVIDALNNPLYVQHVRRFDWSNG